MSRVIFIFTVSILLSSPSFAGMDFATHGKIRSYPYGGGIDFDLGYGVPLWGSPATSQTEMNPWYGYARSALQYTTVGSFNEGEAMVELFPISILGIRGGYAQFNNTKEYSAFDCNTYLCEGTFSRQFTETQLTLGYKGVFLLGLLRTEEVDSSESGTTNFIVPTYGLAADRGGDTLAITRVGLGYRWSDKWTYSLFSVRSEMDKVNGSSDMLTANVHYNLESYSFIVGAGLFESELKDQGFTITARATWSPLKSIGLF